VTAPGPALRAAGLRKRFGRQDVLRGLAFEIPRGRITGLVGPNAAGKTTLIKCALALVRPDAGRLEVLGQAVNGDERYRHQVGYMPQLARFPENLTGREVMAMIEDLRGAAPRDPVLLERFALSAHLDQPVRTLSGGTRQKLSAALAFLFRPELLILDEPTAGLDPVATGIFREELLRARARGAAILLASHTLAELEEVADDLLLLLEGQIRFHGTLEELRQLTGLARVERAVAALMRSQSV
jgi:Cu-processing system ATP-binding protein